MLAELISDLNSRFESKLFEHTLRVMTCCVNTDAERAGDFSVRRSRGEKSGYLLLSSCQLDTIFREVCTSYQEAKVSTRAIGIALNFLAVMNVVRMPT